MVSPLRRMTVTGLLLGTLVLGACGPVTRTTGASFTDPAYRGQNFNSLVVEMEKSGLSERQSVENAAVQALTKNGVAARTSLEILPPTRNYNDHTVQQTLAQTGAQGVLEITPAGKHTKQIYYPPTYIAGGISRHHPYAGGGMMFGRPGYYEPGYVVNEPQAGYNVSLYALPGYTKVWTGEFKTDGAGGMDYGDVGAHFAEALVARLAQDGVIIGH